MLAALLLYAAACGGTMPEALGPTEGGTLRPCPETPNCVHTGDRHPAGTEPIVLETELEGDELIAALGSVVESLPRTEVRRQTSDFLHAESKSFLFRFVDDVELLVTPERELVVRSASRIGRSDLGVNGRRIERLRTLLRDAGLIR